MYYVVRLTTCWNGYDKISTNFKPEENLHDKGEKTFSLNKDDGCVSLTNLLSFLFTFCTFVTKCLQYLKEKG